MSPRAHGALGYALPAVCGAYLARPDATRVVGVMGDGSFGISAGELETIARLHLPVTLIVLNNATESPYAAWPAYAPIAEAMAGFYEQNRVGDEPPRPIIAGALGDIGSALFATIGTLAALRHRERTGLGQQVDIAMYDAMVAGLPPGWRSHTAPPRPHYQTG